MQVLAWAQRDQALAPAGMVALGAVKARLLAQLRKLDAQAQARLSIVATRDMLVVLGADLPWVDGARYCAPDPRVRNLWLPTSMAPRLAPDLLRRSVTARAGSGALLLWPDPEQFLLLEPARSCSPALRDWDAEQCA